jgi:hypothetical protein
MAVSNAAPQNNRRLRDINFIKNVALPNAANTVTTNGMDLVQAVPFPMTTKVDFQVVTTQSTGANSKNINFVLQDSADNSSFTNINTLATYVIAGNAANFPATTVNFALPPGCRRYVRVSATGEANGGNASDGTLTAQLLF